jgi:hypothetical protein
MKVETITFLERLNTGNYCHLELSATAKLEEDEEALTAMLALKTLVSTALTAKAEEVKPVEVKTEEPKVEEVKVEEVKEKKTRAKKEKPVEEIKEEVKKPGVPYDRNIETHRQMLSGYLTKEHPTWKTKEGIKEFSASLAGKEFLDDEGMILESFKKLVSEFFA